MSAVDVALVVLALTFLAGLARVVVGPTLADRAVAADLCLFTLIASLALLSVNRGSSLFLDGVLVATLLGFTATVALARLVGRRKR
ncbi:MAG: monovalent cation/H+ antiporter complex subunit F [Actinomycetota bacterium]|nr:monovalent cation/H+ antiporter complex subunit F [Actinomycetota bacterium]